MDITPSDITPPQPQPSQSRKEKRKAASAAAAHSNKKPHTKQPAEPMMESAQPADSPVVPAPPIAAIEEQMMGDMDGMIAMAAYYLAERRNFAPGHELEDWLEAEQQLRK